MTDRCDRPSSRFLCYGVTNALCLPAGWTGSSCSASRKSSTPPPPGSSPKRESSEWHEGETCSMTCDTAAGMWPNRMRGHGFNPLSQSAAEKMLLKRDDCSRDLKHVLIGANDKVCPIFTQLMNRLTSAWIHMLQTLQKPPQIKLFLFITESWFSQWNKNIFFYS